MLKNKVAIITGGGRGVGKEVAVRFAKAGAKVIITSRTRTELDKVCKEIKSANGFCEACVMDMTSEESIKEGIKSVASKFGSVDILVNNAGTMTLKKICEMSCDEWDSMLNTNVRGVFIACREVLPYMMAKKSGRIINIGSMAGRRGYPEQGAYCASKHALAGLSKVLALETREYNIRINLVSPGGIVTQLSDNLRASRGDKGSSDEWMTVQDVADGVIYLCSQEGQAFTDELVLRRFKSEPWR